MNSLALTMAVIFWLPAAIVILYNLIWDTHFWQSKDYRFDRMVQHLRWDFALSHRKPIYTYIKIALFFVLLSFAIFPGAIAPGIAVVVIFAIWINEVMNIGEKLISHHFAYIDLSIRNMMMLIFGVLGLGVPPVLLSLYLLSAIPPELSLATANLVPVVTSAGVEVIPLTYMFLVLSALLAIAYDLGSPITSAALVLVTSPIAWIEAQFYVLVARLFLMRHKDMLVIAVAGSYSKTTTKDILTYLLEKQYHVATTPHTETTLAKLAMSVITELKPATQVFVAELNAYKPNEMAAMTELLNPQIVLLTGIDESHVGMFGSIENTLLTKSEIVRYLPTRSTVIYNGDDTLLNSIAGRLANKEFFYHIHHDPHLDITENQLEVDGYNISGVHQHGRTLQFTLHNQTHEIEVATPLVAKPVLSSLLGALAAAIEAGLSLESVSAAAAKLPARILEPELISGDNGTLIINDDRGLTIKGLQNLVTHLRETTAPQRILVTTGVAELGKYKTDIYAKIAPEIIKTADIVITYDKHLVDALQRDNTKAQIVLVDSINEVIYAVRSSAIQGAAILLAGQLDPIIIAALRDE